LTTIGTPTGTGNAITSLTASGNILTPNKALIFVDGTNV
jgi:hypothetical protein